MGNRGGYGLGAWGLSLGLVACLGLRAWKPGESRGWSRGHGAWSLRTIGAWSLRLGRVEDPGGLNGLDLWLYVEARKLQMLKIAILVT